MAIPVARVHLAMAHAALPPLLPTPPKWKMVPLLPTPPPPPPCPCVAILIPKPPLAKPGCADADARWDARKTTKSESSASSSSSPRSTSTSTSADSVVITSFPGRRSSPKTGRADAVERWDAHKKAASSASSSSPLPSSLPISRASAAERWDVHKKQAAEHEHEHEPLDDGERSITGSNDIDTDDEEEEILWKPRATYAGPGFAVAAPEPGMLPMPTSSSFLAVRVRVGVA